MKKSILFLILFSSFYVQKSNAQPWVYAGNAAAFPDILGTTSNYSLYMYSGNFQRMYIDWNTGYVGMGTGFVTPNYQLDILGNAIGDGINITGPSNNAVGYSIGGALNGSGNLYPQMFLWHSRDTTSVYCGIHAGYSTPHASSAASYNTFVGNQTGINFAGTGAIWNTAVGYDALLKNTGGVSGANYYGCKNVAVGDFALESLTSALADNGLGNSNTAVGWAALQLFIPRYATNCYANTAVGSMALNRTDTGVRNTAMGYQASYKNKIGEDNVAVGHQAQWTDSAGVANVAVGNWALYNNITSNNTAAGYGALYHNTGGPNGLGANNVAVGYHALFTNATGYSNTGIGNVALYSNQTGYMNTGTGSSTLYSNQTGDSNVAMGNGALYYNTVSWNTSLGCYSMRNFTTGTRNAAIGYMAMIGATAGATGDSNIASGSWAMNILSNGNGNSALGFRSGNSVTTDTDCLFLGALSNRGANAIRNAAAIGYKTITTSKSQMEVGNNSNTVTIGESNQPSNAGNVTPTNLEIATENSPWATGWNVNASTTNYYLGKGTTGLRFKDLTSTSATVDPHSTNFTSINPYPQGVLSVDGYGNVIYIKDSSINGSGPIGYCTPGPLPALTGDAGTNLNTHNFYFSGNNSLALNQNDVLIGYPCGTTPIPAKLNVLQNSGVNNTIGLFVENEDITNGTYGNNKPLVGIKSFIPQPACNGTYNVAGWFEAQRRLFPLICRQNMPYALFVPRNGGNEGIGWDFNLHFNNPTLLFDINGRGRTLAGLIPSDSIIKKNVTTFKYGLSVLRKLNPVNYQYNGIGDFDTTYSYIGVIAQNLNRLEPQATVSSTIIKDSISYDTTTILNVYEEAVLYTGINAIKEVDSAVTSNKHNDSLTFVKQKLTNDTLRATNDSLRYSLDSLRSAFKYYASCLASLCADGDYGHSAIHHRGGGSGDSNATNNINVQDITLSAASGVPLLYQNSPNPFSTGTKINYYLPANTQGANIVFYDSYGNQMKTVTLTQTGNGTINVTPDNLTSGIYSYSLIVNGNVIDTKRMILQK